MPTLRDRVPRGHRVLQALVPIVLPLLLVADAGAQPGRFGFGAQVGAPGGVTARVLLHDPGGRGTMFDAVVAQASFNLDGYLLVQTYLTRDFALDASPIEVFLGPGFVGGSDSSDPVLGVGAAVGVRFYRSRFEVHMQVSPRLHVLPGLNGLMGAGVGLRYFP